MNTKTVYGLENDLDGDVDVDENVEPVDLDISEDVQDNNIDVVYESLHLSDDEDNITWRRHIPSDLQKPITSNLSGKRKSNVEDSTPTPKRRHTLSTSRRRPTTQIKALSRSELAEKYDLLLDKRIDMVNYQNKKMEEELKNSSRKEKIKAVAIKIIKKSLLF
ncbi:uncharacterized protein LOC116169110 [Photinus pyralis]|uniref:uncharacterized protein LOC116169110 n=1 Tax=Photinus pyralis TaxID=7054 RepID=UPI001266F219|nr:uncharacterized protein LOC116169110 [Photinus pyralis]